VITTFYSGSQAMKTYMWYICGCLWFIPLPSDALFTTHMTSAQKDVVTRMAAKRGRKGCLVCCVVNIIRFVHLISKGLFRHLKQRGNRVMIWCVNTKEDLREIHNQFGDQLDGIMTDNPIVLKSYVDDVSY